MARPALGADAPWAVSLGRYLLGPEQFGERQPYSGERNLLVFGPNGSGKGTRFLMPNLLQMRDGLLTSAAGLPSLTCSRTIGDDQNQIGRSGAADNACGIA